MTARQRTRYGLAVATAGLGLIVVGTLVPPAAAATDIPVRVSITGLVPGVTKSESVDLAVPVGARVVSADIDTAHGEPITWDAELCSPATGCLPFGPGLVREYLPAGVYSLRVAATLDETAPEGYRSSYSTDGRISFVQAPAGLASTGASPVPVAALGAIAVVVGMLWFLLGRRERRDA